MAWWALVAVGDERQPDHAHRLLGVVGAVGEREQPSSTRSRRGGSRGDRARAPAPDEPVDDDDRSAGDDEGDSGATTAGNDDLGSSAGHSTPARPTAASSAPITPPISACDELEGSPKYQVIRFQAIAPTAPAKAIVSVTAPVSTIPVATVAATLSEMNAPAKLSTEASAIAVRGDSARVEIEEATTLAVS